MTEQPPPPAYGVNPAAGPPPAGPQPAELLHRFLARLIDSILVGVVDAVIVSAIIVGAVMGQSGGTFYSGTTFIAGAVTAVLQAAINLGYFAFMESSRGQTVGKMVLKLHTLGPTGGNPTLDEALRRNIWTAFGIAGVVPFVGGLVGSLASLAAAIMIAVGINGDPVNRQGWHDKFAGGTRVVRTG